MQVKVEIRKTSSMAHIAPFDATICLLGVTIIKDFNYGSKPQKARSKRKFQPKETVKRLSTVKIDEKIPIIDRINQDQTEIKKLKFAGKRL